MQNNLPRLRGLVVTVLGIGAITVAVSSCSGPQPLAVAIRPADEAAYYRFLSLHRDTPREAFFAWESASTHQPVEEVARADAQISKTRNPFDAHRDPAAVSRGAVIYKAHCISCHGENTDGQGSAFFEPTPKMDFHTFGKRFASTLHRGAPRTWFKKIDEGYTSKHTNADDSHSKMPAFGDTLAREQIWLAITYLQSLDAHAEAGEEQTSQ
jgi:mono/diheme cytochrome c family protein